MSNRKPHSQGGDGKSPRFAFHAEFLLAGERFQLLFAKSEQGMLVRGGWKNTDGRPFCFQSVAEQFQFNMPVALAGWELPLERVTLSYAQSSGTIDFEVGLLTDEIVAVQFGLGEVRRYCFRFTYRDRLQKSEVQSAEEQPSPGRLFQLTGLPVVGGMGVRLQSFALSYDGEKGLGLHFLGGLELNGEKLPLEFSFDRSGGGRLSVPEAHSGGMARLSRQAESGGPSPQGGPPPEAGEALPSAGENGVTWKNVDKSMKAIHLQRIGYAMQGAGIDLYVDAGFTFSILSMEFYGLGVTIPLNGGKFGFHLTGLTVNLHKEPFSLTGGLYKAPEGVLYNGKLELRIKDFSLTALGSYGEVEVVRDGKKTGEKEASFFLYLLVRYPLGGPPCFFVNGLALGFGVNRTIGMPELKEVPRFPFVAAATGADQAAGGTPADELDKLSAWVQPSRGNYFAAAGVAFTSFNMVHSFALLLVEFGARTRVSLLGQSTLTMPPNRKAGEKPFLFAQLVLRAVYDVDAGYLEVLAALTNESYLLDQKCRLQGGFAFCVWTKGERKGDFMVTLGGCHHPLFTRQDAYPKVDKLGVNWQITNELTLKGLGYLAVTPSCVMAGCDVEITYQAGNLHAWLRAQASLYMQWRPFFYDISLGITVGVSYQLKVLFIRTDIRLELGASLHLWGPPFSGSVTIHLWFISFTVRFGENTQTPPPMDWKTFQQSFLPQAAPDRSGLRFSGAGCALCDVVITGGVISEVEKLPHTDKKADKTPLVSAQELAIRVRSELPCGTVEFIDEIQQGKAVTQTVKARKRTGIVPMGVSGFSSTVQIRMKQTGGSGEAESAGRFLLEAVEEAMSPALWSTKQPDVNAGPIAGILTGVLIRTMPAAPRHCLPSPTEAYALSKVAEPISLSWSWDRSSPWPGPDSGGERPPDTLGTIGERLRRCAPRDSLLEALSGCAGTMKVIQPGRLADAPGSYFLAEPVICPTGAAPIPRKEEPHERQ